MARASYTVITTAPAGSYRCRTMRAVAAVVLLALVWLPAGTAAQAAQGDVIVRASRQWHRVPLSGGYGGFLQERYGVDHLDLSGTAFSVVYMARPDIGLGLESGSLNGGFDYTTLNGDAQRADFALQQRLLRAELVWTSRWRVAGGFGMSTLTRELYGYSDESITTGNLSANSGAATAQTEAAVYMGEVLYTLHGGFFGLELGLRATTSTHTISAGDERPAYNSQGVPVESEFDLSGAGYVLSLALIF